MRKNRLRALMVLCLAAAALLWAHRPAAAQERGPKVSTLTIASVDDLLGRDVTNREGTRLAHVGGILLHEEKIAYLILNIPQPGGTWRHFPVPASAAEMSLTSRAVVVDLESYRFDNAPAYREDERPDFSDLEWERQIHSYYGERPPAQASESYILISK